MAIEKKEVSYAKEIDDVMVLVVELVKDIKAGKPPAALAAENLGNLMNAMGGVDQAAGEFAANPAVVLETVSFRVGELAGALLFPAAAV